MSSKPWYAWFPGDYRAKTAHLSYVEDAAYRRLLDAYYEHRGPLPAHPQALYRITSAQDDTERRAIDAVAAEFFTNGDGLLRHARCDEQLAKETALHQAWTEAGRKGGLSRAQASLKPGSTIPSPHPHSSPSPSPSPRKPKSTATPRSVAPVLPDWLPEKQWNAWIESRTQRRNPPTNFALSLAIAKLEHLKDQGHQPAAVLAQSAFRGWAGLFPVKKETA